MVPHDFTGIATADDNHFHLKFYLNGFIHRLDGPAVVRTQRTGIYSYTQKNAYWIHGIQIPEEKYWSNPLVVQYKLNGIINENI